MHIWDQASRPLGVSANFSRACPHSRRSSRARAAGVAGPASALTARPLRPPIIVGSPAALQPERRAGRWPPDVQAAAPPTAGRGDGLCLGCRAAPECRRRRTGGDRRRAVGAVGCEGAGSPARRRPGHCGQPGSGPARIRRETAGGRRTNSGVCQVGIFHGASRSGRPAGPCYGLLHHRPNCATAGGDVAERPWLDDAQGAWSSAACSEVPSPFIVLPTANAAPQQAKRRTEAGGS